MASKLIIDTKDFTWNEIYQLLEEKPRVELGANAREATQQARAFLDKELTASDQAFYGINTGFGALHNVKIDAADLAQLQENLVMSHACGLGEEVPQDIVRLMLVFKAKAIAQGYSGVAPETVEALIDLYNRDILPVIYNQGSLGASGDLAPLAHLALPLIGKGKVWNGDMQFATATVFDIAGVTPLKLQSKEGLALLNGTQFMSAYGAFCVIWANRLYHLANLIAAASIDAFGARLDPFDKRLQQIRKHKGQQVTASEIRQILEDSPLTKLPKEHVQDPYSYRCIPQVHGASFDCLHYTAQAILTEINAVTDNPNIFVDTEEIISGGNFHGQPIALPLDYLSMAMAELGSISEKRTFKLLEGQHGLPSFLVANPGLNSGFMIPQYVAGAIVSQNKQYCTPACVDNIMSCNGQEDHVSMGANAATKCYKVLENIERILAIEWMTAIQALDFRNVPSSTKIEDLREQYREQIPTVVEDRILHIDMVKTVGFLKSISIEQMLH